MLQLGVIRNSINLGNFYLLSCQITQTPNHRFGHWEKGKHTLTWTPFLLLPSAKFHPNICPPWFLVSPPLCHYLHAVSPNSFSEVMSAGDQCQVCNFIFTSLCWVFSAPLCFPVCPANKDCPWPLSLRSVLPWHKSSTMATVPPGLYPWAWSASLHKHISTSPALFTPLYISPHVSPPLMAAALH